MDGGVGVLVSLCIWKVKWKKSEREMKGKWKENGNEDKWKGNGNGRGREN